MDRRVNKPALPKKKRDIAVAVAREYLGQDLVAEAVRGWKIDGKVLDDVGLAILYVTARVTKDYYEYLFSGDYKVYDRKLVPREAEDAEPGEVPPAAMPAPVTIVTRPASG